MLRQSARAFLICLLPLVEQGCVYHSLPEVVDCNIQPVVLSLVSKQDTQCGMEQGSVEVIASGGSGEYMYSLDINDLQPSPIFTNLAAGVYKAIAIDRNNCSDTLQVEILNSDGVNISLSTTDAGCNASEGTITITASNGAEPYSYRINDLPFQSGNTFSGLAIGDYTVVARDNSGCESMQAVTLTSGVTFSGQIKPIIETKCAISSCHNGNQFPDFRQFSNVKANAARIKTLTGNRTMPAEGSLTQDQIDAIACWVDDGALNN